MLVSGSIDLQNKVDQGEIVDTNHVLLIPTLVSIATSLSMLSRFKMVEPNCPSSEG